MCGKSYVIPFVFKGFSKVKQLLSSFTHTRPMSDPEFIFVFHKLSGTQIFTGSQGIQVRILGWLDEI